MPKRLGTVAVEADMSCVTLYPTFILVDISLSLSLRGVVSVQTGLGFEIQTPGNFRPSVSAP